MKHKTKRTSALILALILALGHISIPAGAAETKTDPSYITESDYQYAASGREETSAEDYFIFREDCFMRSSFLGCSHLALLSCQAALASTGHYEQEDKYLTDHSRCAENIRAFLEKAGFSEVEVNDYYSLEKQENSMAVALGQRQIHVFGESYTLLALMPRSAAYGQEWAGNFSVGDGDMHEGYQAARDEALRFLKAYIEKHHITGPLKIWIAGHSRGGATAGLVGGFLAGGGAAYLGEGVTLAPEDIYCYTYASPGVVKEGLSRIKEMTVEGNRTAIVYKADTPGRSWFLAPGALPSEKLEPQAENYGGIRNYLFPGDMITLLPPGAWGFTRYGTDYSIRELGADKEEMLQALRALSPIMYKKFTEGGDYDHFAWHTLDPGALALVQDDTPREADDLVGFMAGRVEGLMACTEGQTSFVQEGFQAALVHMGGLYGLISAYLMNEDLKDKLDSNSLVMPALLVFLSYGMERMQAEKGAARDGEALAYVLEDLLAWFSGQPIDHGSFTVDGLLEILAIWLAEHESTPLGDRAYAAILGAVPESLSGLVRTLIGGFHPDNSLFSRVSLEEAVRAYIRACAYGADPASSAAKSYATAEEARSLVFTLIPLLGLALPQLGDILDEGASTPFTKVAETLEPLLRTLQDGDGREIQYDSLALAAEGEMIRFLTPLMEYYLEDSAARYGQTYQADIRRHWEGVKTHMTQIRRVISYALFYEAGKSYSTGAALANVCTFGTSAPLLPSAHYNEDYTAWMKAAAGVVQEEEHYIEHVAGTAADQLRDGLREHWAWHEGETVRYFTDRDLSRELMAGELVIPKETEEPTTAASSAEEGTTGSSPGEETSTDTENPTGIPPETAPGESGIGEGGPTALWIAVGLLAAGCGLAGILVWKKNKEVK